MTFYSKDEIGTFHFLRFPIKQADTTSTLKRHRKKMVKNLEL